MGTELVGVGVGTAVGAGVGVVAGVGETLVSEVIEVVARTACAEQRTRCQRDEPGAEPSIDAPDGEHDDLVRERACACSTSAYPALVLGHAKSAGNAGGVPPPIT